MRTTIKKLIATLLSFMMVFQMMPAFATEYPSDPLETDAKLVEKLRILNTQSSVLQGSTITLSVPEGYTNVAWSSKDEGIATVAGNDDGSAVVTGVAPGSTEITASSGDQKTNITIKVIATSTDEQKADKNVKVLVSGARSKITYDGEPHEVAYKLSSDGGDGFDLSKVKLNRANDSRTEPGVTLGTLEAKDFSYEDLSYNVTFEVDNGYVKIVLPNLGENEYLVKHVFLNPDKTTVRETRYEKKEYGWGNATQAYPVDYDPTFWTVEPAKYEYSTERLVGKDGLTFTYTPKDISYTVQFHLYNNPAANNYELYKESYTAPYGTVLTLQHDYKYLNGYKFIGVYKDFNTGEYYGDGTLTQAIDSNSKCFLAKYEWDGENGSGDTGNTGNNTSNNTGNNSGDNNPQGEKVYIDVTVDETGAAAGANYSPEDQNIRELSTWNDIISVFNWNTDQATFDHFSVEVGGVEVAKISADRVSDYYGRGVQFDPEMNDDPSANDKWTDRTYVAHFRPSNATAPNTYTITWKMDDGSVIDTTTVAEGIQPSHDDPEKAEDDKYTYTFSGWSPAITEALEDTTYTATFTPVKKPVVLYNLAHIDSTWYRLAKTNITLLKDVASNYDGKLDPSYYEKPSYDFENLDITVNGKTYVYGIEKARQEDGSVLAYYTTDFEDVEHRPSKIGGLDNKGKPRWLVPKEQQYPELTANNFHANYKITLHEAKSAWKQQDLLNFLKIGSQYYRLKITGIIAAPVEDYGTGVSLTEDEYTLVPDSGYDFSNLILEYGGEKYQYSDTVPTDNNHVNCYTIDKADPAKFVTTNNQINRDEAWFKNEDGYLDGSLAQYQQKGYTNYAMLAYHRDYKATFHKGNQKLEYTITFKNGGTVLQSGKVAVGTMPEYTGETPVKAGNGNTYYEFKGWSPEITPVTGNATYTAVFEEKQSSYSYTVHHYLKGTTTKVADDVTGTLASGTEFTATPVTTYQSRTLTVDSINPAQPITITSGDNANVVTIYYTLPLEIKPTAAGKTYGDTDPELAATVTGKLDGDTVTYKVNRENGSDVGTYKMTISDISAPGYYTITTPEANFTITKKTVSVTVTPGQGKVYGAADPEELATTVTGLVGSDTLDYTVARAAGETVGEYDITITLGDNPNYEVTKTDGIFTISKKSVTLTIDPNQGKTYGETDPTLTATPEGLEEGDTLNYDLERAAGETVGEYGITVTLGNNPNYEVTVADINKIFTISRRAVTVTANNETRNNRPGTTDPEFSVTIEGVIDGESTDLITYTTLGRAEGDDDTPGPHAIIVDGVKEQGNYEVTFVNGVLTITDESQPLYNVAKVVDGDTKSGSNTKVYGSGTYRLARHDGAILTQRTLSDYLTGIAEGKRNGINRTDYAPYSNVHAYDFTGMTITINGEEYVYATAAEAPALREANRNYFTVSGGTQVYASKQMISGNNNWLVPEDQRYSDVTDKTDCFLREYTFTLYHRFVDDQTLVAFLAVNGTDHASKDYYRLGVPGTISAPPVSVYDNNADLNEKYFTKPEYIYTDVVLTDKDNRTYKYSKTEQKTGVYDDHYTVVFDKITAKHFIHGTAPKSDWFTKKEGWLANSEAEFAAAGISSNTFDAYHVDFKATLHKGNMIKDVVTLTAASDSKTYDGLPLQNANVKVEGLPAGYTITATAAGSATNVNDAGVNTVASYTIKDADGKDVTANFVNVKKVDGKLTINPKAVTVKVDAGQGKVYGDAEPTLKTTVNGLVGSDTLDYSVARTAGENVGNYPITITLGENPNYSVTKTDGSFAITQKPVTVSVDANQGKVYGDAEPTLKTTVNGLVGSDTLDYSVARKQGENAGSYPITITMGSNPNYSVTKTDGTFTITKKPATVSVDANQGKVYGDAEPTLTTTVNGLVGSDKLNYTVARARGENAGDYAITITLGSNPNYSVTKTDGTFVITKKPATVSVDSDQGKVYGDAEPTLKTTVNGLVGSDKLNYTVTRIAGENVGQYAITITLGENPNYEVTKTDGTFTITQKPATVSVDPGQGKVYGAADPEELKTTTGGLVGSDTLNYTVARAEGEDVGEYAITITLGENPNYSVTVTNGIFTIGQLAATIVVDPGQGKVYGDAEPSLTATPSGMVGDDTLNYTLSRTEGENVGEYDITITLGENPNYYITITNGIFEITKKPATIVVDPGQGKVYGDTEPTLTATPAGMVNGDTLVYTLSRVEGENAGTYGITVTPGDNPNYDITVTNGTFEIAKKPATIVVDPGQGKVYGNPDPALTATPAGMVDGDTLNYTLSRKEGEDPGNYPITVKLGDNPNYDITVTNGTFVITADTETYTLTITYLDINTGKPVAEPTVDQYKYNDHYEYDIAEMNGYVPLKTKVEGNMPKRDHEEPVFMMKKDDANGRKYAPINIDDYGTPLGVADSILGGGEIIE